MTREELIANTALQHRYIVCTGFNDPIADCREKSFISGAKWADKTMIEKACRWLSNNKDNYILNIEGKTIIDKKIVDDFKKSMEE